MYTGHVIFAGDPNLRKGYDVAALIKRDLVDFIVPMACEWMLSSFCARLRLADADVFGRRHELAI